jgi:hypothetical protein
MSLIIWSIAMVPVSKLPYRTAKSGMVPFTLIINNSNYE